MNAVRPTEVINLALSDTSPSDYRFRLREFAMEFQPDAVVIFLFAGNDFPVPFQYQPYHSRPFLVTRATVDFAAGLPHGAEYAAVLEKARRENHLFQDRQEYRSYLGGSPPPDIDDLLYMGALAYSRLPAQFGGRLPKVFPHTRLRLQAAYSKLVAQEKPKKMDYPDFLDQVAKFYVDTPESSRLKAIADLVTQYLSLKDAQLVEKLLLAQGPRFVHDLIAEKDKWDYLMAAIMKKLEPQLGWAVPQPESESTAAALLESLKLLQDIAATAKERHVPVFFVLIPMAEAIDSDFISYWSGLCDFHTLHRSQFQSLEFMAAQLPKVAPTLNLTEFPADFDGGYGKFDGHWNEVGNTAAEKLVRAFLVSQKAMFRKSTQW